ncbi:MAG: SDR family NAD(P)-dependent oxidoreductase, partial [Candidatus Nanopelagicales bacterium]
MDLKLKGMNAIVTGGSKGIGRAIVEGLAAEGVNVAFCARGAEGVKAAEEAIKANGGNVIGTAIDVGNKSQLEK